MAININNLNSNNAVNNKSNDAQVKQANTNQSAQLNKPSPVQQDSVSITPQAQKIAELQKKANDAPQVNQKKVEKLKEAITNGDYKVNPEKLAASIAKFEFDLI